MLSNYPNFTDITIDTKNDIESITKRFESFSDFNFISMLCWNTDGSAKACLLNGNLVISLPDYLGGEPVYSILGNSDMDSSIRFLLNTTSELSLVPQVTIDSIADFSGLKISESQDHFDYIYSAEQHASLSGPEFSSKRKKYKRFARNYEGRYSTEIILTKDGAQLGFLTEIFDKWAQSKDKHNKETEAERKAIERFAQFSNSLDVIVMCLRIDGAISGFSIHEIINETAIAHFHKTDSKFDNIDVFLTAQAAQDLVRRGCKFINWEQDLGVEGLRHSKQSYNPVHFLKKYKVEL